MYIDILTLFPAMFQGPLSESILRRAQEQGLLQIHLHDLKEWGLGNYRQVDDEPYGGGAGMVLRVDVLVDAIESIVGRRETSDISHESVRGDSQVSGLTSQVSSHCILLSARGERLTQQKVEELSRKQSLLLVCGHYEGIDQRVVEGGWFDGAHHQRWIDEEISIGDYVLTGGELPAMVLIDSVARLLPGVLGKDESSQEESFSLALDRKREYPHYTRPEEFRGLKVPEILLSGHHKKIEKWRIDKTI